jgi:hypothetical protein
MDNHWAICGRDEHPEIPPYHRATLILPLLPVREKVEGSRTRFKGILWNIEQSEEVVFAHQAIQGFCRLRGFTRGVLHEY